MFFCIAEFERAAKIRKITIKFVMSSAGHVDGMKE